MTTASDLIKAAALKLGAIETGESLTASEAEDSLNVLNSWLDNLSINGLMIYHIAQNSHSWAGGSRTRTIGSGGQINTDRPIRIEEGTHFTDSSNIDYPVTIIRDRVVYDNLTSKLDTTDFPSLLYYEPDFPLGILYVYPVPSLTITLKLNSWEPLQSFANLSTDITMPNGYRWMIENNLAIHLEPIFGVPVPNSVTKEANSSMARIESFNHIPAFASTETVSALHGSGKSDIREG